MISFLRSYLTPHLGRFSSAQLLLLAEQLRPSGFFAIGPLLVLVDLPARFQKVDPEPSLLDINDYLRELFEAQNPAG